MNHPKHLARLFAALAFVLSNVMCASIDRKSTRLNSSH